MGGETWKMFTLGLPTNVPGQCITTSGDQPNRPCIFPWKYSKTGSVVYNGCSGPLGDSPWCPTELTDGTYISGSGKWGYCDMAVSNCQEGTYLQGLTKSLYVVLYSQFQKKSYKVSICPRKIFCQPTKMGGKRNR